MTSKTIKTKICELKQTRNLKELGKIFQLYILYEEINTALTTQLRLLSTKKKKSTETDFTTFFGTRFLQLSKLGQSDSLI